MIHLKPRGRLRSLSAFLDQSVQVFAESRVNQHSLDLIPGDSLQDDPGIMRDFPQSGIKLSPNMIGGMIPGPAHVQSKFRQGIETVDFSGQEIIDRVAYTGLPAHDSVALLPSLDRTSI